MRAYAAVFCSGCVASATGGVMQKDLGDNFAGSVDLRAGIGGMSPSTGRALAFDTNVRVDVGDHDSRLAFGGGALGGLRIAGLETFARVAVWHASLTTAGENTLVPSFELGAFIPFDVTPATANPNYGWHATGVVFGVREDLDVSAYTTVFVGEQIFLSPGY